MANKLKDTSPRPRIGKTAKDTRVARLIDINKIVEEVNEDILDLDTRVEVLENAPAPVPSVQPLIYRALLSQTGTAAPVATVNENTLSGAIVWTRDSAGYYIGTLVGAFTTGKTHILLGNKGYTLSGSAISKKEVQAFSYAVDTIEITTDNNVSLIDGVLDRLSLTVIVYP